VKFQRQILGIRWFDFVSNIDVLARIGLTPLSDILAVRRISVFGHIVRLENDDPAHMALRRHVDLSVGRPRGREWKRRPGRPGARWIDQVRQDSNTSPVELWRVEACRTTWSWCWSDATAVVGYAIMLVMSHTSRLS